MWLGFMSPDGAAFPLAAAAAVTALLCFAARFRLTRASVALYIAAAWFLAASLGFAAYTLHFINNILPLRQLAGQDVIVEGFVTAVDRGGSARYTLNATFPEYPALKRGVSVVLRGAGEYEGKAGDVISFTTELAEAPSTLWYRSRGIILTAYGAKDIAFPSSGGYRFDRAAVSLREYLSRNIYAKLPERTAGLVSAMSLGLDGEIPAEIYTATSKAGVAHLLAVSGLHISIMAGFVASVLGRLRVGEKLSAVITMLLCFLFCVSAGFSASVSRALIMTCLTLAGRLISRRSDSLNSLGLALLSLSALRPEWVLGWGMWLSFGATAGIILYADKLTKAALGRLQTGRKALDSAAKYVSAGIGVSVAAHAFTLPVMFLMSGWVSLVTPLTNVLVAPFVPAAILGGIICAAFPGMGLAPVAAVTDFCAAMIIEISKIFSGLPFAIFAIDEGWLLLWFLAVAALIAAAIRRGRGFVKYAAMLAAISFSAGSLIHVAAFREATELVSLQDRGAAVLLRGSEAVVLGTPDNYEASNLIRYLDFRGVETVRAVIATDCGDNVGAGVPRLAGEFDLNCILAPDDEYIIGALGLASPESKVYGAAGARLEALGSSVISASPDSGDIYVQSGGSRIIKRNAKAEEGHERPESDGIIEIYDDGVILLPRGLLAELTPLGTQLFGERRFLLSV